MLRAIKRYARGRRRDAAMAHAPALRREGLSRRDFLHASGALIVSFSAATIVGSIGVAQGQFDTRASHVDPAAARLVDRHRRRRHGHGVHRQVRARPGHPDRADAARRRGALRAARSRAASCNATRRSRPIRARRPAASRRRRTSTSAIWRRRAATAREALLRHGVDAPRRCRWISPVGGDGVDHRDGRSVEPHHYGELVGGTPDQHDRGRQREAEAVRPNGPCSAPPCRASTWPRWRPVSSSSSITCACPACCTARVVRPPAARRHPRRASTRQSVARRRPAWSGGRQAELRRRGRREAAGRRCRPRPG